MPGRHIFTARFFSCYSCLQHSDGAIGHHDRPAEAAPRGCPLSQGESCPALPAPHSLSAPASLFSVSLPARSYLSTRMTTMRTPRSTPHHPVPPVAEAPAATPSASPRVPLPPPTPIRPVPLTRVAPPTATTAPLKPAPTRLTCRSDSASRTGRTVITTWRPWRATRRMTSRSFTPSPSPIRPAPPIPNSATPLRQSVRQLFSATSGRP